MKGCGVCEMVVALAGTHGSVAGVFPLEGCVRWLLNCPTWCVGAAGEKGWGASELSLPAYATPHVFFLLGSRFAGELRERENP